MYTDKEELIEAINMQIYKGNPEKIKEQISAELLNDNDVIFELIKNNQQLVNVFGDKLIEKPELMDKVFNDIDSTLYHRLSDDYKNNEKFMLQLLEIDPNATRNIGDNLRKNLEFMEKAAEINSESVYYADPEIKETLKENVKDIIRVDDVMKSILTPEKYKLISNYPETQKIFKKIAVQKNLSVLEVCIEKLNEKNLNHTEWTRGLEKITDNILSNDYQEMLSNIDVNNVDKDTLFNVLQGPNYYNIKTQEQLENYENIKTKVCNAIINEDKDTLKNFDKINKMGEIEQTQFAVLQKQYGIDVNDAETIWEQCSDIDEIKDNKLPETQSYIGSVINVLKEKSKEMLQKIYKTQPTVSKENDSLNVLNDAKKIYANEFNKTLFKPQQDGIPVNSQDFLIQSLGVTEEKIPEDIKVIDAGTEFNMILTSIGAFSDGSYQENNYYKNWNREIKNTQGVSCSYIGNDMRATAPIQEFCFGFSEMAEDSLLMQGTQNLGSTTDKNKLTLKHIDKYIENFTPDNLKNFSSGYNEMVYNRVQNDERKQPDYIVIFKQKNRTEGNINSALKAVEDFKAQGIDLPIVIVDIEKCKEAEKERLNSMINEYKYTKDEHLKEEINNKIRRNRVTNNQEFSSYYQKLDEAEKHKVNIIDFNEYKNAYMNTTAEERKQETEAIININKEIQKTSEMER